MKKHLKFAPRDIFEEILEYAVIPTFDLVIEVPPQGVLLVRRTIDPYANQWALPGLRMMKPESIDDVLRRIAQQEVGLRIDLQSKMFLGQFVGRFKTEHNRQDISTGYAVRAVSDAITLNDQHFSGYRIIGSAELIPSKTGAMYSFYLKRFFSLALRENLERANARKTTNSGKKSRGHHQAKP